MAFTFQQGTKLVLDVEGEVYELLVSSASASQTFLESNQRVKTIHNPNVVERTFVTEKGRVNLSFSCYLDTGTTSKGIMDWFGFSDQGSNTFKVDPNINILKTADIYIVAEGTTYKIDTCVGQNISFSLSRRETLKVDITGVARDIISGSVAPTVTQTQNSEDFYNGTLVVSGYDNLSAATCEITREINWLNQKTLHDTINGIYLAKNPVLDSMSISGSITQYKTENTNEYTDNTSINLKYGSTFEINLDACNTTERWDMSSIHKKVTDYKLLPIAVNSYIKF